MKIEKVVFFSEFYFSLDLLEDLLHRISKLSTLARKGPFSALKKLWKKSQQLERNEPFWDFPASRAKDKVAQYL